MCLRNIDDLFSALGTGNFNFFFFFAGHTLLHFVRICICLLCYTAKEHISAEKSSGGLRAALRSVSNLWVIPVNHILHSHRPKTLLLTSSIPGLAVRLPPTAAGRAGAFGRGQDFFLP